MKGNCIRDWQTRERLEIASSLSRRSYLD